MCRMDRSVRPANVTDTTVDDEAVLLDTQSEEFIGLNEVATRMWECLVQGNTLRETARELEAEYEVDSEQLKSDLLKFVDTLVERQILEYC